MVEKLRLSFEQCSLAKTDPSFSRTTEAIQKRSVKPAGANRAPRMPDGPARSAELATAFSESARNDDDEDLWRCADDARRLSSSVVRTLSNRAVQSVVHWRVLHSLS